MRNPDFDGVLARLDDARRRAARRYNRAIATGEHAQQQRALGLQAAYETAIRYVSEARSAYEREEPASTFTPDRYDLTIAGRQALERWQDR